MECVFCKVVAGEIKGDIVYKDEIITAFRDINPQAPVHILVVPNEHIPSVQDICPENARTLTKLVCVANELAVAEGIAERGYRLLINCGREGGQSVEHLHLHLLGGRAMHWPPG